MNAAIVLWETLRQRAGCPWAACVQAVPLYITPGECQKPHSLLRTNRQTFTKHSAGSFSGFLPIQALVKGFDSGIKLPWFRSCFHPLPVSYFPSLHIITISCCPTTTPHFSPIPAFSTFYQCSLLLPITIEFYWYPEERNNREQSIHFH